MKEIQLSRGMIAKIDDEDFEEINKYKWYILKPSKYYAATRISGWKGPITYLHRFIMKPTKKECIDHIDGDGLNCQKYNMRKATKAQNCQNIKTRNIGCGKFTSIYKGVYLDKYKVGKYKPWFARCGKHYVGIFWEEIDAARAYDKAAKEYFGEFAKLNFPE